MKTCLIILFTIIAVAVFGQPVLRNPATTNSEPNVHANSADAATQATNAQNVFGVSPNTLPIALLSVGFCQGVCNDGTNFISNGTTAISKSVSGLKGFVSGAITLLVSGTQVTNGLDNFSGGAPIHLGDPDWYGGIVFAPLEATVGGNFPLGMTNLGIAMYNGVSGGNLYKYFSVSNYQREISSVTIGVVSNNPTVFASAFLGLGTAAANNTIFEYKTDSLTNLTFVKALTLNTNLVEIQGLKFVNGVLYALCDQVSGFGSTVKAGRLFAIDVTNETATLVAELNVPGQTEWEGLDNYNGTTNTTTTGIALPNEGATGWYLYNLWNYPAVSSSNVFFGIFIGDISQTRGQISDEQLPGDVVRTNSNSTLNQLNLTAGGFGSFISGNMGSGVGFFSFWNNNKMLSLAGRLATAFTVGNNTAPNGVGATFFTWDIFNNYTIFGVTNKPSNALPGSAIFNSPIWAATNSNPSFTISQPVTLGTIWSNTTSARADFVGNFLFTDATTGTPLLVISNLTTGLVSSNSFPSVNGTYPITVNFLDLSPTDQVNCIDASTGSGASVSFVRGWLIKK